VSLVAGKSHDIDCDCFDCSALVTRFVMKNTRAGKSGLVCVLDGKECSTKPKLRGYMLRKHGDLIQKFKHAQQPKLFEAPKKKRQLEVHKPQAAKRPAQEMIKFVNVKLEDNVMIEAARKRDFLEMNVLSMKSGMEKCKLCYLEFPSRKDVAVHIATAHKVEVDKEDFTWERYIRRCAFVTEDFIKCQVSGAYFRTIEELRVYVGQQVILGQGRRHVEDFKNRKMKWESEEEEQCCGNGMVETGSSLETVMAMAGEGPPDEDSDDDDEDDGEDNDAEGDQPNGLDPG